MYATHFAKFCGSFTHDSVQQPNVIADSTVSSRSFVFSQSHVQTSASLNGLAVPAFDLTH